MALIDIITNNQTRQNRNTVTYEDNWVYIPGNTITGDYSKPYFITSLQEFQSQFGSYSPEGFLTYEYVSGVLNAGLPVLFRRIVKANPDEAGPSGLLVTSASYTIKKQVNDSEVPILKFTDKFGGSFGNDLYVFLRSTASYYILDVGYGNVTINTSTNEIEKTNIVILESVKLAPVVKDETTTEINNKLYAVLSKDGDDSINKKLQRIDVEVLVDSATNFDIAGYINSYDPEKLIDLSGGTDIPTGSLSNFYTGVANSFYNLSSPSTLPIISDKLLYRPKYLCTGGICETVVGDAKSNIILAMMKLSELRQDCLALVDLTSEISDGQDFQDELSKYGYTQTSATQILPSATCVGPWYYTLVNGKYLWMPGSYAYLQVVGNALSIGGNTYTPKAGASNGRLYYTAETRFPIGQSILEEWQKDEVVNANPIIRIQGGNYEIAGNSTLLVKNEDEENLYSETSAVMTVIEIKRHVYETALQYQYMYNSVESFENFSIDVAKLLDSMKTEGAVYDYNIINNSTNDEPRKLKILLQVWLTPTIKNIEIYLNIAYGDVRVSSVEGGNN